MTKIIFNKFDKQQIASLPVASFPGRIIVVLSEYEAAKAVRFLLSSQQTVGIDTETRPSFYKGHQHMVSLLQVSTANTCFLFRLNHIGMCDAVRMLLEDERMMKVGLSLHDDVNSLRKLSSFTPANFVDLQDVVRQLGIEDMSLQKIYANLLGGKISKRQQLSNWEADILTEPQKLYAATDAWACLMIYNEYLRLVNSRDYELKIVNEQT